MKYNLPNFQPGDRVTARLWPELGTGEVVAVTDPTKKQASTIRVADVVWPDVPQRSRHAFIALRYASEPVENQEAAS